MDPLMDRPTGLPMDQLTDQPTDPLTGLLMDQPTDRPADPPINLLTVQLMDPLINQLINPMRMTVQIWVSSLDWSSLSPSSLAPLVVTSFIPNSTKCPKLNQSISKPMKMLIRVPTNQAVQAQPGKIIPPKHRFSFLSG